MYQISDLKKGVCVEIEGAPYQVVDYQHIKMARQAGMLSTKLKNLHTGAIIEKTFKSGDKVKPADVGYYKCQFLYPEGEGYVFMRNDNYEQFTIGEDILSDDKGFLTEGDDVDVRFFGNTPIGLNLPPNMVFEVIETVPGVKGDTVTGGTKPAVLSTGISIQVPLFVKEGEKIRVDTRTKEYLERANN